MLLAVGAMPLPACPLPDVPFAENHPPVLDSLALKPLEGVIQVLDCSSPDVQPLPPFDLGLAIEDPDGDELRYLWYINYNDTAPDFEDDTTSITVDCFSDLKEGANVVEVIIMDRPSQGSTAAALRRVEDGGYAIHIVWPVIFTPSEGGL